MPLWLTCNLFSHKIIYKLIEAATTIRWHSIVSAARSLTCRDDLDSKWWLLLAENELSRVSLLSRFLSGINYPSFILGVSTSEESIKVAEIACSTSQIKMATLKEAL